MQIIFRVLTVGLIISLLIQLAILQTVELPSDKGSCSVVNVNCGGGQDPTTKQQPSLQGSPGKRGPTGPMGPQGPKGSDGRRGAKGDAGATQSIGLLRSEILKMFGASSCAELLESGISESGFYLLRSGSAGGTDPIYIFCVFQPGYSTCHELKTSLGLTKSGRYEVKPSAQSPFYRIHCNFSTEQDITTVWHDNMGEIKVDGNCDQQGCYSWVPKYELSAQQILGIISHSHECRQYVKFRCNGVLLFRNEHGHWISRSDEKMIYWGGATSRRTKYCACGETGSCVDNAYKCNCDNNDINVGTSDEGYLTDKTKLPLKELKFGDNGDPGEHAWHTVGGLECMG